MIKRFWDWILEQSATGCAWLALRLECLRVGHRWQLGPNYAWCEHCEAHVKGERARKMFEAKHGPYVKIAKTPWPMPTCDPDCPPDSIYIIDMSKLGPIPGIPYF